MPDDELLEQLKEARGVLLYGCDNKPDSRALALVLTHIDTAILWRQEDLRLRRSDENVEP
jgi:nitrogenase subunit NifH